MGEVISYVIHPSPWRMVSKHFLGCTGYSSLS
jgi:hypothetical protein